MARSPLTLLVVFLFVADVGMAAAPSDPPTPDSQKARARRYLESHVATRLAQAKDMVLVLPHWEHGPAARTDLFLANNFREPLDAEVTLFDPAGRVVRVDILTIEPASHLQLPLSSLATAAPGAPSEGSARVRYSGDKDMMQAWSVLRGPGGAVELVAKNVSVAAENIQTSFWDTRGLRFPGGVDIEYSLVNGGTSPIIYRTVSRSPEPLRVVASGVLAPGERRVWSPRSSTLAASHGWVQFEHDGAPGALAVTGVLRGRSFLSALPVTPPEVQHLSGTWQAIRLPFLAEIGEGFGQAVLTLLNPTTERVRTEVDLVDTSGGQIRAHRTLSLRPGEVESIRLDRMVAATHPDDAGSLRLVVRGETGLLAHGIAWSLLSGVADEITLFPHDKAHATGSYPVPDPSRGAVTTTLVNVGTEESRIVGQLSWLGGTYALGPLTIPAGGTQAIDFGRLVAEAEPDILGRTIDPSFANGHFHWTVQGGSTAVLARTEATSDAGDTFGFNCFGCCLEQSFGDLIPGEANFATGSSTPFEGVEFIESCTGTMGPFSPYAATWNYGSPFTWTGSNVSASAPAVQSLWFTAQGHRTAVTTCEERPFNITDIGSARSLKVSVLDASLPTNTIRVKLEPTGASGTLKVYLSNPSQRVLTSGSSYSGGTHTLDFGSLSTYSNGQEFNKVIAEWTVAGKTVQGTLNYRFKVLGNYNHTRYNTPTLSFCSGPTAPFCHFTGSCATVQTCSIFGSSVASSQWLAEVFENGSGLHPSLGFVSREWFCALPQGCGYRLRQVPQPCPYCQGLSPVAGQTVAVHPSRESDLPCGTTLFVDGIGLVTVADHGTLPSTNQLDHYAGTSGCNRTAGTIGIRKTFKIY